MSALIQPEREEPKISVVIPVYEAGGYIVDCLTSLLAQTYSRIEILLVDDCGKDGSIARAVGILEQSGTPFSWAVITHEKNMGSSAARNSGIKAATGRYVYFLDEDDRITPNCLELLCEAAEKENADFSTADCLVIEGDKTSRCTWVLFEQCQSGSGVLELYLERKWHQMQWNKLVRRDFLIANGLFFREGLVHEDELWSFQLACCARTMAVVQEPTYFYCRRENSMTSNHFPRPRFESFAAVHSEIWGTAAKKGLLDKPLFFEWFRYNISFLFKKIMATPHLSRLEKWRCYADVFSRLPREYFVRLANNIPREATRYQRMGYALAGMRPQFLGYLLYAALVEMQLSPRKIMLKFLPR